jgi:hypothetical protein
MMRTGLSRYLWWVCARMGLCLAGIDDDEVQRLRFRRLRLISPLGVGAVILTLLGSVLTAGLPSGSGSTTRSLATTFQFGSYAIAGVLGLGALAVLIYARIIVRRALRDRSADPVARRATLRGFISARDGGWPVRLQCDDGHWLWLTGSLTGDKAKRQYRLTVALVHHPRSKVIREISGLKVEVLHPAWRAVTTEEPSPA